MKNIIGIELLVTDQGEALVSKFGHSLVRLVDDDQFWANDIVISFVADSGGEGTNLLRGISGGYKVTADIKTLNQLWNYYTANENRGFLRYPLALSFDQRGSFLTHLYSLLEQNESFGDYKFFTNNCVTVLSKLFIDSGISLTDDKQFLPTSMNQWIDNNLVFPFVSIHTPNYKNTKIKFDNIIKNGTLDYIILKNSFTDLELGFIFLNYPLLAESISDQIANHINVKKVNINDIYLLNPLNVLLYQNNTDQDEIKRLEQQVFSTDELNMISLKRFKIFNEKKYTAVSDLYKNYPVYLKTQRFDDIKVKTMNFKKLTVAVKGNSVFVKIHSKSMKSSVTDISSYELKLRHQSTEIYKISKYLYQLSDDLFVQVIKRNKYVELFIHQSEDK
jgi:hypothetical protein